MGLIPLGNVSEPLSSLLGSGSRSPPGWVSGVRTGKGTREPAAWELQPEAVLYGPRPLLLPVPAPQRAPGEVHDMNWLSSPARWVFSVDVCFWNDVRWQAQDPTPTLYITPEAAFTSH